MICVLDGLSGVGRNTLATRLQADLPNFISLHFGVPDRPDAFQFFMEELREVQDADVIINRLHFSNYAYQNLFGGSVLTDFDHWRLDQWVAHQPSVAILLVDEPHAIHARLQQEQQVAPARHVLASPREIGEVQNRLQKTFARSAIGQKWSFGIDQLLSLEDGTVTKTYEQLLNILREEEVSD